ncbi:MAG: hypothetical protein ACLQA5_06820 [Solirubrobacteraceae bacterium]
MAAGHVLTVGDRIRVSGGYDYQPDWLAGGTGYTGTVVAFIPGQNEREAAVVRFGEKLVLATQKASTQCLNSGTWGLLGRLHSRESRSSCATSSRQLGTGKTGAGSVG